MGGKGWHRVEITRVVITRCYGDKVLADEVPQPRTRLVIPFPTLEPLSNIKEHRPTSSLILFTGNHGSARPRIFIRLIDDLIPLMLSIYIFRIFDKNVEY